MIDIYGFDCNPNYANKDGYNVLIISIMRQLLNVSNKIIDRFGTEFKSDQLTIDGYSALYGACLFNLESLILKIIEIYGNVESYS